MNHKIKINGNPWPHTLLFELSYRVGGCTCSDFVNKNGYGLCRKDYKDGPICYVNLPSQCKDLVNSSKDPSKKYSWEACKNLGFGAFQDPAK